MNPVEHEPLLDRPDRKAVLIGRGGELGPKIGSMVLNLTGAESPNVLIIPTAAQTPESHQKYIDNLTKIYAGSRAQGGLGARTTLLHDFDKLPSKNQVEDLFGAADAIAITGGNTTRARKAFTSSAIGQAMINFKGVTSGGSAGLILQTVQGLSWYTPTGHPELNDWITEYGITSDVSGRSIVNVVSSPHLDFDEGTGDPGEDTWRGVKITDPRSEFFKPYLESLCNLATPGIPGLGLGVDHTSAIAFDGESFKVINAEDAPAGRGVTAYGRRPSGLVEARFTQADTPDFIPTSRLTQ